MSDSYRMAHQAPGPDGVPAHDLLATGHFPDDVYDRPDWYTGYPDDEEMLAQIRAARGRPDAPVTIYRAAPAGCDTISTGDWVTLSCAYARQHAMQDDDPAHDWPVYTATVEARHVHNDGNDLIEWGYNGPPLPFLEARAASRS